MLNAKGAVEKFSRKGLDELTEYVRRLGAKGLAWVKVEAEKFAGGIEKFLPAASQQALRQRLQAQAGDLLLFVADREAVVCQALGNLRAQLAADDKIDLPRLWTPRVRESILPHSACG